MAAPTDDHEPTRATVAEAASWMAQVANEDCSDADRAAFRNWMAADDTHRIAAERMGIIADRIGVRQPEERAVLHRMLEPRSAMRPLGVILVIGGLMALGWWGVHDPSLRVRLADERSPPGIQRRVELASGDSITLDGGTALDVDSASRSIRLWRGGVMAQVAHGRSQPFVVLTPQGNARAMGTRYSVRLTGGSTIVTVIASQVEACASMGNHRCIRLDPGQTARLDASGATPLPDVDTLAADAWSHGLLYADDRTLASVAEELNHYRDHPIILDPSVGSLRLSGSFPLTDPDRALASISAALPVTVEDRPAEVVLRPRIKN